MSKVYSTLTAMFLPFPKNKNQMQEGPLGFEKWHLKFGEVKKKMTSFLKQILALEIHYKFLL